MSNIYDVCKLETRARAPFEYDAVTPWYFIAYERARKKCARYRIFDIITVHAVNACFFARRAIRPPERCVKTITCPTMERAQETRAHVSAVHYRDFIDLSTLFRNLFAAERALRRRIFLGSVSSDRPRLPGRIFPRSRRKNGNENARARGNNETTCARSSRVPFFPSDATAEFSKLSCRSGWIFSLRAANNGLRYAQLLVGYVQSACARTICAITVINTRVYSPLCGGRVGGGGRSVNLHRAKYLFFCGKLERKLKPSEQCTRHYVLCARDRCPRRRRPRYRVVAAVLR